MWIINLAEVSVPAVLRMPCEGLKPGVKRGSEGKRELCQENASVDGRVHETGREGVYRGVTT